MAAERLEDLSERDSAAAGRLADVEARLEAESPQDGRALLATFALVNGGSAPLELLNPFDLVQWQLLDERGAPLALPRRAPNLLVHRPASAEWKLDPSVPIAEVRRGGERIDATTLDSPTVELEPGTELAATFAFDRLPDGGGTAELGSGDYRLVCTVTLIDAADADRSRIVRSRPLPVRFERA